MSKKECVVGRIFGRLLVVGEIQNQKRRKVSCICECGNSKDVDLTHLRQNRVVSCGCYRLMRVRESNIQKNTTHGMSRTRLYKIWLSMKYRCDSPKDTGYKYYGGSGIGYDDKWSKFEGFLEDMEDGYSEDLELDRIDGSKGYYKENCRWADKYTQAYNKKIRANNTSGKTGVHWGGSCWRAEISKQGKYYFLGNFKNYDDAVSARRSAELFYYGELLNE